MKVFMTLVRKLITKYSWECKCVKVIPFIFFFIFFWGFKKEWYHRVIAWYSQHYCRFFAQIDDVCYMFLEYAKLIIRSLFLASHIIYIHILFLLRRFPSLCSRQSYTIFDDLLSVRHLIAHCLCLRDLFFFFDFLVLLQPL